MKDEDSLYNDTLDTPYSGQIHTLLNINVGITQQIFRNLPDKNKV